MRLNKTDRDFRTTHYITIVVSIVLVSKGVLKETVWKVLQLAKSLNNLSHKNSNLIRYGISEFLQKRFFLFFDRGCLKNYFLSK